MEVEEEMTIERFNSWTVNAGTEFVSKRKLKKESTKVTLVARAAWEMNLPIEKLTKNRRTNVRRNIAIC